jgi:hypothetical protein
MKQVMLFVLLACAMWACRKIESSEPPVGPGPDDPGSSPKIETSVQGRVLDEHSVPLAGASVSCGGKTTTTNAEGTFLLKQVSVPEEAAVVTVTKNQYIYGSRTLMVYKNSLHFVEFILQENQATGSFVGSSGGKVVLPETELTVPANAVTLENNNPYTGIVDVNYRYIDPLDDNFPGLMAGDLRGISKASKEQGLESFDMFFLETLGQNGEKLKLNQSLTIKIDIPGTLQSSAPASIPLWRYDSTSGYWKEDATANRSGDSYIATVKNTGYWQCARPYDAITLKTTVVDQDKAPVQGMRTTVFSKIDFIPTFSFTDTAGRYIGKIPANKIIIFALTFPCLDQFEHEEIGPFSAASTAPAFTVTISEFSRLLVSGTATNCANQPVKNGTAEIVTNGLHYATSINNGNFKINIGRCANSNADVTIRATDDATRASLDTTISTQNGSFKPLLKICTP